MNSQPLYCKNISSSAAVVLFKINDLMLRKIKPVNTPIINGFLQIFKNISLGDCLLPFSYLMKIDKEIIARILKIGIDTALITAPIPLAVSLPLAKSSINPIPIIA